MDMRQPSNYGERLTADLLAEMKYRKIFNLIITVSVLYLVPPSWQFAFAADAVIVEANAEESAVEISNRHEQQIASFRQEIESVETEFGPYHQSLLEPLKGLTDLFIAAGDFEAADGVLNRRLQLFRVNYGPASPTQIPTLAELIRNDIRRAQWQAVTDTIENIHWIQTQDPAAEPTTVLNSLNAIGAWHFTAMYLDDPRERIGHYQDASDIQRRLLRLAEEEFGEDSPALIPWLYQDALEYFRVVALFRSKDELGARARSTMVRLESRRAGLNQVKRMRRIIESMDNAEAAAMAMVYEADFQRLLGLGTAPRLYRNAMETLEAAGINKEKVEAFFARPLVLPEPKFYFSLDQAFAAQSAYGYTVQSGVDDAEDSIHMGDFIAWNESLPYARRPEIPELTASVSTELYAVEVSFAIDSVGNVRTARAQWAEPDRVRIRRDAQDAIEEMQFRPKFANGRGYRARNVTMRYLYPPPL